MKELQPLVSHRLVVVLLHLLHHLQLTLSFLLQLFSLQTSYTQCPSPRHILAHMRIGDRWWLKSHQGTTQSRRIHPCISFPVYLGHWLAFQCCRDLLRSRTSSWFSFLELSFAEVASPSSGWTMLESTRLLGTHPSLALSDSFLLLFWSVLAFVPIRCWSQYAAWSTGKLKCRACCT